MTRLQLLEELSSRILQLECSHPIRVAIDGVDGAGKTTFAGELVAPLERGGRPVIRASVDGFHNPRAFRYRRGRYSPEGYYYDSFDYDAVRSLLLYPLGPNGNLNYRPAKLDLKTDSLMNLEVKKSASDAVLLFDGVFLLRPELLGCWDYKIFLYVDFAISVERAILRDAGGSSDTDEVRALYEKKYTPGQQIYFRSCNPKKLADVVVNNNDIKDPIIEFG